jgi:hypothetical protein
VSNPTQIVISQTAAPKIDVKAGLPEKIEIRPETRERVCVNFAPVTINNASSSLLQLTDVQLSSPTQGDILSYNQSISKWANIKQSVVTDGGNF